MGPSGTEPTTFRLVAQCLNQMRKTCAPNNIRVLSIRVLLVFKPMKRIACSKEISLMQSQVPQINKSWLGPNQHGMARHQAEG